MMTDPVFFEPSRRYSAAEVARLTGAELLDERHAGIEIAGIAPASTGGEGMLVYVEGRRNARLAEQVRAAAVLCTADIAEQDSGWHRRPGGVQAAGRLRADRAPALSGRSHAHAP